MPKEALIHEHQQLQGQVQALHRQHLEGDQSVGAQLRHLHALHPISKQADDIAYHTHERFEFSPAEKAQHRDGARRIQGALNHHYFAYGMAQAYADQIHQEAQNMHSEAVHNLGQTRQEVRAQEQRMQKGLRSLGASAMSPDAVPLLSQEQTRLRTLREMHDLHQQHETETSSMLHMADQNKKRRLMGHERLQSTVDALHRPA